MPVLASLLPVPGNVAQSCLLPPRWGGPGWEGRRSQGPRPPHPNPPPPGGRETKPVLPPLPLVGEGRGGGDDVLARAAPHPGPYSGERGSPDRLLGGDRQAKMTLPKSTKSRDRLWLSWPSRLKATFCPPSKVP